MIQHIIALPAFEDNYIWLLRDNANNVCAVDPGDPQPVLDYLEKENCTLAALLITHHHPDHTGGITKLAEQESCPVYGPSDSHISGITRAVAEGDKITVLGSTLAVLEVPGHTLDHIAYVNFDVAPAVAPQLFCGDTLFAGGCGRLFEGTPEQMLTSLEKLASLPPATEVYCTHEYTQANLRFALACEPNNVVLAKRAEEVHALRAEKRITLPSTIGVELESNPFLRCEQAALQVSAEKFLGQMPSGKLQTFAAIRAWKDEF